VKLSEISFYRRKCTLISVTPQFVREKKLERFIYEPSSPDEVLLKILRNEPVDDLGMDELYEWYEEAGFDLLVALLRIAGSKLVQHAAAAAVVEKKELNLKTN
jgi:hypothetical protein